MQWAILLPILKDYCLLTCGVAAKVVWFTQASPKDHLRSAHQGPIVFIITLGSGGNNAQLCDGECYATSCHIRSSAHTQAGQQ